jgi:hypothetical protein
MTAAVSPLIEHKDLTSYITSLPKTIIEQIFDHPTTCLTIFRYLILLKLFLIDKLKVLSKSCS